MNIANSYANCMDSYSFSQILSVSARKKVCRYGVIYYRVQGKRCMQFYFIEIFLRTCQKSPCWTRAPLILALSYTLESVITDRVDIMNPTYCITLK